MKSEHQTPCLANPVVDLIGSTPVIELYHGLIASGKTLLLKLEYCNPSFSIKDRTAYGLIEKALQSGYLKHGGTIIESTSGNLGKSLAMLSAAMGFNMIVVVDPKVSKHNLNWYRAYGAKIELVEKCTDKGGYQMARIARVKELLQSYPEAYWPNQYENPDNKDCHEQSTALEFIHEQFDILVGCVSTGGHLSGIARALKKHSPDKKILACDVVGSAIFGNQFAPYLLNGVGLSWRTQNTELANFDYRMEIADVHAISLCHLLARDCGLLFGGSAGLNVFGALSALQQSDAQTALAIIPDSGLNYLDQIYDADWLKDNNVSLLSESEIHKASITTLIEEA